MISVREHRHHIFPRFRQEHKIPHHPRRRINAKKQSIRANHVRNKRGSIAVRDAEIKQNVSFADAGIGAAFQDERGQLAASGIKVSIFFSFFPDELLCKRRFSREEILGEQVPASLIELKNVMGLHAPFFLLFGKAALFLMTEAPAFSFPLVLVGFTGLLSSVCSPFSPVHSSSRVRAHGFSTLLFFCFWRVSAATFFSNSCRYSFPLKPPLK